MVVANNAHAHVPKVYQYPRRENVSRGKVRQQQRVNLQALRRVAAGVFLVAMALLVIFRYGQISSINMEINSITNTRNALVDEQRHLEITLAQLTALDRLETIAFEELGMQYPRPEQIRYVGNNPEGRDGDGE